ncbi:MAG TPA: hypothetical protein VME23_01280 [Terracidiphilus sp.]|nr:hypothetical protein [Terracidiphilus sp.]
MTRQSSRAEIDVNQRQENASVDQMNLQRRSSAPGGRMNQAAKQLRKEASGGGHGNLIASGRAEQDHGFELKPAIGPSACSQ